MICIPRFLRHRRARHLAVTSKGRRIRIHSIAVVPDGQLPPVFLRVAFEFIEKPGPWSMQFYEAAPGQQGIIDEMAPGIDAVFYESSDGARTRVLALADGRLLLPR